MRSPLLEQACSGQALAPAGIPPVAQSGIASGGQQIDPALRGYMEARFGESFGTVRVHTGKVAADLAQKANARAYTLGDDIVFNRGEYAPGTVKGSLLLAHELSHVVQQRRGGTGAPTRTQLMNLESSANQASYEAIHGSAPVAVVGASAPVIACQSLVTGGRTNAAPSVWAVRPPRLPVPRVGSDAATLRSVMEVVDSIRPVVGTGQYALLINRETMHVSESDVHALRETAHRALSSGLRKVRLRAETARDSYLAQQHLEAESPITWTMVKFFGRVDNPGSRVLANTQQALTAATAAESALAYQRYARSALLLARAERLTENAESMSRAYRDQLLGTAETTVAVLEHTRDAALLTLGVLAAMATGGAAAGAGSVLGLEIGGSATAISALSLGAPVAVELSGAGVGAILGNEVDWAQVTLTAATGIVVSHFGGKLSQALFDKLVVNHAVRRVGFEAFASIVNNVMTGGAGRAFDLSVQQVYQMFRGQRISWKRFLEQLTETLLDPNAMVIDAIMGGVDAYARQRFSPHPLTPPVTDNRHVSPPPMRKGTRRTQSPQSRQTGNDVRPVMSAAPQNEGPVQRSKLRSEVTHKPKYKRPMRGSRVRAKPPIPGTGRAYGHRIDVSDGFQFETYRSGQRIYKQARGPLGHPDYVVRHRSKHAQGSVSRGTGDDAGHLIGNQFGAPGTQENLSMQNFVANRGGTWKDLESYWASRLRTGIYVEVSVTDISRTGENRPFARRANWTEITPAGAHTQHSLLFANMHTVRSRQKQNIPPTVPDDQIDNVILFRTNQ